MYQSKEHRSRAVASGRAVQPFLEERLREYRSLLYIPGALASAEASTGAFEGGIFGDSFGATCVGMPFGFVRFE
jgi:hypothetical protein